MRKYDTMPENVGYPVNSQSVDDGEAAGGQGKFAKGDQHAEGKRPATGKQPTGSGQSDGKEQSAESEQPVTRKQSVRSEQTIEMKQSDAMERSTERKQSAESEQFIARNQCSEMSHPVVNKPSIESEQSIEQEQPAMSKPSYGMKHSIIGKQAFEGEQAAEKGQSVESKQPAISKPSVGMDHSDIKDEPSASDLPAESAERRRIREIVKRLNIIDDALFQKMAEDRGFCEEMISTVLGQKVVVKKVVSQSSVKNLQGRSVVLDALCELEDGRMCNVEVQKADDDNHEKRVRYNSSCVTANVTEPGAKFENVPDVIVIYISRFDMFKSNKTVYHIDRVIRETGQTVDNGLSEIYVNAKVDDGSDVARMMKIFTEDSAYDDGKFPKVSERKRQFKEDDGGEVKMCDLIEDYAREREQRAAKRAAEQAAAEATRKANAAAKQAVREATAEATRKANDVARQAARASTVRLFENGADYGLVRSSITGISDEELTALYRQATGKSPAVSQTH